MATLDGQTYGSPFECITSDFLFYTAALLEQTLKHGQPTELLTNSNTLDLQEMQIQHQSEPAQ